MSGCARLLAVVDDAAGGAGVLDAGCVLAQLLRRELQLVFVEDAAALAAAELPMTQVLGQGRQRWETFGTLDVERGWRVQADRLRTLALQAAARRAVPWSLRVTRGCVRDTTHALLAGPEADLLLVAAASTGALHPAARTARRRVAAIDDGGAAGRQALEIARQLAEALAARLEVSDGDIAAGDVSFAASADLLVLPRGLLAPPMLAARRVPALLVGAASE